MKRTVTAALVLLLAASQARAGQWIGPFIVTRIEADTSTVYFYKGTNFPNSEGCASAVGVKFESSDVLVNRAISIGLAAKTAGMQVRFFTSGCSIDGYIRAYSIDVS